MKSNITLIGMPGAGKSTTGIILAKNISKGFLDTDILIQINQGKPLQQILDEQGHLALRKVEEEEVCKINIENCIISTGGSVAYSKKAMEHLQKISTIIFLEVSFEEITHRITNFESRGIAKAKEQSFYDLFLERQKLYSKYADITLSAEGASQDEIALRIVQALPI